MLRQLSLVECKFKERPEARDLRGIKRFRKFYEEEAAEQAFIACLTDTSFDVAPGVTAVPGWQVWALGPRSAR
jgi:hypothetical protein